MHLSLLLVASAVSAGPAPAADPSAQEDLRFVRRLRERGDADLALEVAQRLTRDAPPALAHELLLEQARARLQAAADEPDSSRRLDAYARAQGEFEKYLAQGGGAGAVEIQIDLAELAVLRGRTQLSRALLQETPEARDAESARARDLLVKAGEQLRRLANDLARRAAAMPDTTPEERAAKKRLEDEWLRAELNVGLNLFDQAETIAKNHPDNKVALVRAGKVAEAKKVLERLGSRDDKHPVCWQARAWAGRCDDELGEPKKARARYALILAASPGAAAEGQRLARYFRMLVIKDSPEPGEKPLEMVADAATRWLADYPRYGKSREGYGVRYLLARVLVDTARETKAPRERDALLERARATLRPVEQSENEFTDRARGLKAIVIGEQGGFTRAVTELKTFDDCYVRAQYEIAQLAEDAGKIKDPEQLKRKRQQRLDTVLAALDRGLQLPEAKKGSHEADAARAMYAYYALRAGKLRDAARVGEELARSNPRAPQAPLAVVYALEALGGELARRQREAASPEDVKEARDRLLALAAYAEERWPKEVAADVARHQSALLLLRDKEPNYPEALRRLEAINPTYPDYARAQWDLAQAALTADREKAAPVPGDKPGGYRERAMAAWARIPEPGPGADPQATHLWLLARTRLGREMFAARKFDQMQQLAEQLRGRVKTARADADDKRNAEIRSRLAYDADELLLYAAYGQAEADYAAGRFDKAAARLDPVVKEFNEGKWAPLRRNTPLGTALLGLDLRANVQLGRLQPAQAVLTALQGLAAEGGAQAGTAAILGQLAAVIARQLDDFRKKGDKAAADQAVAHFTQLLDEIDKKTPDPKPTFVLQLARCYANLGQHQKAADRLDKVSDPGAGPEASRYRGVRLMLVRELRQAGDPTRARAVLDEIMGTPQKPGWGARDISALKEKVLLLEADGQYAAAARLATTLVDFLKKRAETDNALKEQYLECYFHMAYAVYKHGQAAADAGEKERMLRKAAGQIVELEKKWDGYGSDTSRQRFEELLAKEVPLRECCEQMKAGKGGAKP
jgi:hypothetical protein